jgi:GcrA cell cycle regulator
VTAHQDWTDERIGRLKALWAEGQPASVIAAELGLTRNAVIGKANRLKLAKRPHHNPLTVRRAPARPKPPPPPDTSRLCTLFELSANTCRWPIEGGYCGHHAEKTYCAYHRQIGIRKAA